MRNSKEVQKLIDLRDEASFLAGRLTRQAEGCTEPHLQGVLWSLAHQAYARWARRVRKVEAAKEQQRLLREIFSS